MSIDGKPVGFTRGGAALLLTREYMEAGRCLNPACDENHLADLGPEDVAVLACCNCGQPAMVAWQPAQLRLVVGCPPCGLRLACIELPTLLEALARVEQRASARLVRPAGMSS